MDAINLSGAAIANNQLVRIYRDISHDVIYGGK
jgi:hypothetical protein